MYTYLHIGIDDIDTYEGGCTTHFATYIVEKVIELNGIIIDYPRLIRLNPDVPWKTRGNGAVALELIIQNKYLVGFINWIRRFLDFYLENIGGRTFGTQPCIIILDGNKLDETDYRKLSNFAHHALYRVISQIEVKKLISHLFKKGGVTKIISPYGSRGMVGSVSAIGNYLIEDYSYELLVYRPLHMRARQRGVIKYDKNIEDEFSFAHFDLENKKCLLTPQGPDPVAIGIRGERISSIMKIFRKIERKIYYDRWMIYITNQATNQHILYQDERPLSEKISYYNQFAGWLNVISYPIIKEGGHVSINTRYLNHELEMLVYEPSGRLREISKYLKPGHKIYVVGGVKPSQDSMSDFILNTQLIIFSNSYELESKKVNPICPNCKKSMKSLGDSAGYFCKKCKYHIHSDIQPIITNTSWHPHLSLPPYRSILHISKPLKRYGREKRRRYRGLKKRYFFWSRNNPILLSISKSFRT
jgi:tRNA(Ile2)-agmatinylcytidine synthase